MTIYVRRVARLVIGENVFAIELGTGETLKDKLLNYTHLLEGGDRVEIIFEDGRVFHYIYKAGNFIKLKLC